PDIGSYAPVIHSVFDTQSDGALRIPYSIADQNIRQNSRIIDGFLSILDLCGGRFGNAQVLSLLEFQAIREKFALANADLKKIEFWIRDTHIRWGIDAENRATFNLPGVHENTWKAGIERILLGYAMPGYDQRTFSGILPYDHIEGSDGDILGNFVAFIDRITAHVTKLNKSYNLAGWRDIFIEMLEEIFQLNEETTDEVQLLRRILGDMVNNGELAGYDKKVDFQVIRYHINGCLERETFASGFIAGGVTFCTMLPMRNIPSAVVCLIGMNSDAFPRDSIPLSFDLLSQHPKPGDRSRRNDDKYLFLEALLSAREKLYISYVGQNIQDNTPIPPSVMVSELIDYLTAGFGLSRDQLVTRHKLQAFSPSYFKDNGRLFSFSEENFQAAGKIDQHKNPTPFISTVLSIPADDMKQLDINTLCAFYAHPTKFLLQKRLGLFLETGTSVLNERENFMLDPLENHLIGQSLFKKRLSGLDLKALLPLQKGTGQLPHGKVGEVAYSELSVDADIFVKKIEAFLRGKSGANRHVDLELGDFVLIGELPDIYERGRIGYRFANTKAKDLLRSWINHLVFCLSAQKETSLTSILICKDSIWEFNPVKDSREILTHLLKLYWKGLSTLIHFFPESSHEYAKQLFTKKQPEPKAMALGQKKWT
ncbi:MAG: exodeoxyribonuclease V subunit gamma, partial [Desulfobacterales bacterium]